MANSTCFGVRELNYNLYSVPYCLWASFSPYHIGDNKDIHFTGMLQVLNETVYVNCF